MKYLKNKIFYKKPTLERKININKKIFLNTVFVINNTNRSLTTYDLYGMINIGTINFKLYMIIKIIIIIILQLVYLMVL